MMDLSANFKPGAFGLPSLTTTFRPSFFANIIPGIASTPPPTIQIVLVIWPHFIHRLSTKQHWDDIFVRIYIAVY